MLYLNGAVCPLGDSKPDTEGTYGLIDWLIQGGREGVSQSVSQSVSQWQLVQRLRLERRSDNAKRPPQDSKLIKGSCASRLLPTTLQTCLTPSDIPLSL